jgi:hypothetical protein
LQRGLDDDEKDALTISDAMGRPQKMTIISEPGLYKVLATCRKEKATALANCTNNGAWRARRLCRFQWVIPAIW